MSSCCANMQNEIVTVINNDTNSMYLEHEKPTKMYPLTYTLRCGYSLQSIIIRKLYIYVVYVAPLHTNPIPKYRSCIFIFL